MITKKIAEGSVNKGEKISLSLYFQGGRMNKTLAITALSGILSVSAQALSMDIEKAMESKPIDTPTLDYFKTNDVLIPQKDGNPATSPGSAYTIERISAFSGDGNNIEFAYTTADQAGGLTVSYYEVKTPENNDPTRYSTVHDNEATVESLNPFSPSYRMGGAEKVKANETKSITDTLFVNNKTEVTQYRDYLYGGALYNAGKISDLAADFINNSATASYSAIGGAVYNDRGAIGNITGDFIRNSASSVDSYVRGGAIHNRGDIGNITGDFIANSISSDKSYAQGGALYTTFGSIGDITGEFIANSAVSGNSYVRGGAIFNLAAISKITGDFIDNLASSSNSYAQGSAIFNSGAIGDVAGDFVGNSATAVASYAQGGGIYNSGAIGRIAGDFISNAAASTQEGAHGGAIYNYTDNFDTEATLGDIAGDFINNSATGSYACGGAIFNHADYYAGYTFSVDAHATIGNITGNFIDNAATAGAQGAQGGAVYNDAHHDAAGQFHVDAAIGNITGDFIRNSAASTSSAQGGAIYNKGSIGDITGRFINNSATGSDSAAGGAIAHEEGASIGAKDSNGHIAGGIVNSSFIGNFARSENGAALGGALFCQQSAEPLKLVSRDGHTSIIKDNYTESQGKRDDNAIYLEDSAVSFRMENGGQFYVADNIDGNADGMNTVNITGDSAENTMFHMLNDIRHSSVNVGSTTLNTINNNIHPYHFSKFTLTGHVNMRVDVDLAQKEMDMVTADEYGAHTGNLRVIGVNLLSDSSADKTEIQFAQKGLKEHVANGTSGLPDKTQTTAYTPIYKYNVSYENRDDAGYFIFSKKGDSSEAFNPSVLASPIATQLSGYLTMVNAYDEAFRNMDMYALTTKGQRQANKSRNRYEEEKSAALSDSGKTPYSRKAGWFRPYTTFENVPLKNGPKVSHITYGSYVGAESEMYHWGRGWDGLGGAYIGYNGSHQSYDSIDMSQNGGLLGVVGMAYKARFYTGITVNAGASSGEANTMYGDDRFSMFMAGIASKSGYNIELQEGKFIIQPHFLMSYSFVNTFDYTNAAGVNIHSDPLHAIQLEPGFKFIANLDSGWQPYVGVSMVWNLMDKTHFHADDIALPELSVKPFAKCNIGVHKTWSERFTGFFQCCFTGGGRDSIGLHAGFRWVIGEQN